MLNTFVGNSTAKEILATAVKSGRFPHAFIIEGEPGSGRRTFAKMLAAAAVCEGKNAPCGKCRACELVSADGHCDVLSYSPDGATFKVDQVRRIRDGAYVMPIEAKRKVNLLLDCDKMNDSAQNALLKVLEEPPSFMVFILVCRNASALLPTVRSRCVTVSIRNPEMHESVSFIAAKTGRPEEDIREALSASHGNIGKALSLLDGARNTARDSAKQFLEALEKKDRLGAVKVLYTFEKDRPGFSNFLSELRFLLVSEIKKATVGGDCPLPPSRLTEVLKILDRLDKTIREHIGQPLQLSLVSTCLCAEIFEQL